MRPIALILLVACGGDAETDPKSPDTPTPETDTGTEVVGPVDADGDGVVVDDDCDDADASVGRPVDFWPDEDADGYGAASATPVQACEAPADHVQDGTDCDDTAPDAFPGAPEVCDGLDQDCDGEPDNGLVFTSWYLDEDGDGYGGDTTVDLCSTPTGPWVLDGGDCDEGRGDVNPAAREIGCNTVDEDCDGAAAPGDWNVPGDFPDLPSAVAAAGDGDAICIEDGDYAGLLLVDHSVDLVGIGSAVRLHTGNGARVVSVSGGPVHLENLILDGRSVEPLLQVSGGADVSLVDVVARDIGCNTFCSGLVAYVYAGGVLDVWRLVVDAPVIETPLSVYGLLHDQGGGSIAVHDTHLDGHSVDIGGGSFFLYAGATSSLEDVSLTNLDVVVDTTLYLVGDLRGSAVSDLTVAGNTLTTRAPTVNPQYLVGWFGVDGERVTLVDNTIIGNYTSLLLGDGVLRSSLVARNVLDGWESAPAFAASDLTLSNVTVADNRSTGPDDCGVEVLSGESAAVGLTLLNTVFADNAWTADVCLDGTLTATYSSAWGDAEPVIDTGGLPVAWPGLVVDPGFAGLAEGYGYTLDAASPLLDAGDPALSDPDGSRSDIGAFGGPAGWP